MSENYFLIIKTSKKGYKYVALRLFYNYDGTQYHKDFPIFTNDFLISQELLKNALCEEE